ncbi:potassium channel [Mactra antiquata]
MMAGTERQGDHSGSVNPELHEISQLVKCRMSSLNQPLTDYDEKNEKRDTISYVVINPGYDLQLKLGDVIYLIRPSSLSPKPSPLIDERKQMPHHTKREEPTGADNSEIQACDSVVKTKGRLVKDGNNKIPIIYMDDSDDTGDDEITENDKTTSENTERNKNIPTFDLPDDNSDDDMDDASCHSDTIETPVCAVKGTVV